MPYQRPKTQQQFANMTNQEKYQEYMREFRRASANGKRCGALYSVIQWERNNQVPPQPVPLRATRATMQERIEDVRNRLTEAGQAPMIEALMCNVCLQNFGSETHGLIALDCAHGTCAECFLKIFDEGDRKCPSCRTVISEWRWMYI